MASISFEKYKIISDNLGEARTSILAAIDKMFSAVYEVAVLDDVANSRFIAAHVRCISVGRSDSS